MPPIPHILAIALTFTAKIKYILLFVGALVEGPILMVVSGFLLRYEVFSPVPLYIALIGGDLVGDVLWYYLGYFFAEPLIRNHGKFIGVTPELFEKAKGLFSKYHEKILVISKLTLGFGFAVGILMVAGVTRVNFRKYMLINILGEFILVAMLLSFGYFFGELYRRVANDFKIVFIVILSALVLAVFYGISKYFRKRALAL